MFIPSGHPAFASARVSAKAADVPRPALKARGQRLPRRSRFPLALVMAGMSLLLPIVVGCGTARPTTFDDPVAAMVDPELRSTERQAAMRQASEEDPDNPSRIEGLKAIMAVRGQTLETRIEAYHLLEAHDPQDARFTLMMRLPSIEHYEFVAWASERAAEQGWVEFTPALVRSLDRPMPLIPVEDRAETRALLSLHPDQALADIIFAVILQPTESPLEHLWRLSAWNLFVSLGEEERLLDLVSGASIDPNDPLLVDVQAAARDFNVLPRTREELKWLQALRLPEKEAYWAEAKAAFDRIPPANRAAFGMRHIAVVRAAADMEPSWLAESRSTLMGLVEARLAGRDRYTQNRDMEGFLVDDDHPQTFRAWADQLVWGDLLALLVADEIIQRPEIQLALLAHAERDRADRSTELGGILDWQRPASTTAAVNGGGSAVVEAFYPRYRRSDTTFQTPQDMLERGYTGLFHYHFHAQEVNNAAYAGPGPGDLEYAEAMGVNGLVFTSVGLGRLNADFYAPGQIVIDLGEIGARGN